MGTAAPAWRDAGLALAVGVSNTSVSVLDQLAAATGEMPEVNQVQYGPSVHDPLLLADHRERGVVFEGYQALKMTPLGIPTSWTSRPRTT